MCLGDCGIIRRQVRIGGASALAVACGPGSTASATGTTPSAPVAPAAEARVLDNLNTRLR